MATQSINFSSDPQFKILYDAPATTLSFELKAYLGYSDLVNLYLRDSNGSLISSTIGLSVPGGSAIPSLYSGPGVSEISVVSQLYPWSPILDNHQYLSPMHLTILGPCLGRKHVLVNGASPWQLVAFGVGLPGSFTIPGGPCAGTVVDLDNPFLGGLANADGNGDVAVIVKVPAGVCGLSVQALDVATCSLSDLVVL